MHCNRRMTPTKIPLEFSQYFLQSQSQCGQTHTYIYCEHASVSARVRSYIKPKDRIPVSYCWYACIRYVWVCACACACARSYLCFPLIYLLRFFFASFALSAARSHHGHMCLLCHNMRVYFSVCMCVCMLMWVWMGVCVCVCSSTTKICSVHS